MDPKATEIALSYFFSTENFSATGPNSESLKTLCFEEKFIKDFTVLL